MIKGVLIVQSTLHDTIEQRDVEQALERNWSIRKDIIVKVEGATVRLSGIVSSLYKKEEAGHIASKAPGITLVDNRLIIHFNYKKNNLKN
ncbi:BON domain-containing protein [Flavobacterium pectinovorum]|uniref:BON domain-containing protein n=2 Tax=Flavobacterium pectinovorum TaxID=29533 RepID=A0A502EBI9_9FLAO|nr:BON domain-containing protein [Flavobacterium pectinovorum]